VESKIHATDRVKAADTQYHLTEKAQGTVQGLARYFERALGTPTGQKVRVFYQNGEKQVLDIHAEAKRLAEMKKGKRRSQSVEVKGTECTCVGEQGRDGECKCEPGKCECEGCKRKFSTAEKAPMTEGKRDEKATYA